MDFAAETGPSLTQATELDLGWLQRNGVWNPRRGHFVVSIFGFPMQLIKQTGDSGALVIELDGDQGLREEHLEIRNRMTCRICKADFGDITEMRNHYKSDMHVSSIRRHSDAVQAPLEVDGGPDAGEADGPSESDSSAGESGDGPEADAPVPNAGSELVFEEGEIRRTYNSQEGLRNVYHSRLCISFEFSVSSAILDTPASSSEETSRSSASPWAALRRTAESCSINPMWCVISLRSGKFAGAIFDGTRMVVHKTFRRYIILPADQAMSQLCILQQIHY